MTMPTKPYPPQLITDLQLRLSKRGQLLRNDQIVAVLDEFLYIAQSRRAAGQPLPELEEILASSQRP